MYKLILELMNEKGTKNKEACIDANRDNEYFRKFLYYALNPMLTYNISTKTAKELVKKPTPGDYDKDCSIFWICEELSNKKGLNQIEINQIHRYLWDYPEDQRNLYIQLLSKSLRLGVTATTVNKIIPGLIPVWEVQQAFSIEQDNKWEGKEFWLTQKLNGVRATYYKGQLLSRNGQPYTNMEHIIEPLKNISSSISYVFDGELTLKDKGTLSDNEAFRKATGIANSDAEDKTEVMFTIFDMIPTYEFDSIPSLKYSERRAILDATDFNSEYITSTPVLYHGKDVSIMYELLSKMVEEDKEGLMMNLDVCYQRKRHNGILKVKKFYTMDLPIVGIEEGTGRLKGTTGALVVDFNGNNVRVGTGLSDADRQYFWLHNNIGTIIEIKYKEISSDKGTGKQSLQFPVFIRIRTDKDNVSYS